MSSDILRRLVTEASALLSWSCACLSRKVRLPPVMLIFGRC